MSLAAPRRALESAAFGALQGVASVTPRPVLRRLGAALGAVLGTVDRRHRRIALDNLSHALGDVLDREARRAVARKCWRHFGSIVLEALAFPRLDRAEIGTRIRVHGVEHVRRAYESGRGVVVFTGHFGNWELAAVVQAHLGLPLSLLARPLDNPALERRLARIRACSGNRIIYKRNAVREMMRLLRAGGGIAFMIDQDARADGVFVPFFGRLASTTPTFALLAYRTGAVLLPCRAVPDGEGGCDIRYGEEIPVHREADRQEEILRVTAHCTAILEGWIRENPEYWLWMHRRWKTSPPP